MKLVYQYVVIFFNFQTTSNHLHPLQVEDCGSNSRLVVGEDDYGKFRIERVKRVKHQYLQTCVIFTHLTGLKLCAAVAMFVFLFLLDIAAFDIKQQYFKIADLFFPNLNNFHPQRDNFKLVTIHFFTLTFNMLKC